MSQLTPIELDDGTVIHIETTESMNVPKTPDFNDTTYKKGTKRGGEAKTIDMEKAMQKFQTIEGTIRSYTTYTLNAFKEMAVANVDKVTLEFGIKVSGKAGIPFVTSGTAESNLKVTVQCSFPKKSE